METETSVILGIADHYHRGIAGLQSAKRRVHQTVSNALPLPVRGDGDGADKDQRCAGNCHWPALDAADNAALFSNGK